jgi:hypothetical protein
MNLALRSISVHTSKWFLTCRKVFRYRVDDFTSPPQESFLRIFIAYRPRPGFNPRTSDPMASTLATTLPRMTNLCLQRASHLWSPVSRFTAVLISGLELHSCCDLRPDVASSLWNSNTPLHCNMFLVAGFGTAGGGVRTATHDGAHPVCRAHDGSCHDSIGGHIGSRTHMHIVQWQVTLVITPALKFFFMKGCFVNMIWMH